MNKNFIEDISNSLNIYVNNELGSPLSVIFPDLIALAIKKNPSCIPELLEQLTIPAVAYKNNTIDLQATIDDILKEKPQILLFANNQNISNYDKEIVPNGHSMGMAA